MSNWKQIKVEDYVELVTDYVSNGSFASLKQNVKTYKEENYALMVKTADFANNFSKSLTYTDEHGYEFLSKSKLFGGELVLSNIGSVGKVFRVPYYNRPMTLASNSIMIRCKEELQYKWMYYFFLSPIGNQKLNSITTGTTMKKFNKTGLRGLTIPLPSFREQLNIVARIEELFSELDSSVKTLKMIKAQLKVYRQAVLKEAFDGICGKQLTIKDVCVDVKVGIVIKPSQYYTNSENGVKAFRSANVREFHIDDFDWVYLSEEGQRTNSRSIVHTGDVLIVRSGYPGTACVVQKEFDGCNAIDILIAVPDRNIILPEFLCAYTNSPFGKAFVNEKKRGVGQKHFNVGGYCKMGITVPDLKSQKKIVDEIESNLSVCTEIQQTVDAALQQTEVMRQSILKKAFEGKLL